MARVLVLVAAAAAVALLAFAAVMKALLGWSTEATAVITAFVLVFMVVGTLAALLNSLMIGPGSFVLLSATGLVIFGVAGSGWGGSVDVAALVIAFAEVVSFTLGVLFGWEIDKNIELPDPASSPSRPPLTGQT